MFQFVDDYEFWWPVTIKLPQDGGGFAKRAIEVRFRVKTQDEIDAIIELSVDTMDQELVTAVVVGWRDIETEDGDDLPFTAENLARLVALQYWRVPVLAAYFGALQGVEEKN